MPAWLMHAVTIILISGAINAAMSFLNDLFYIITRSDALQLV